MSGVLGGLLGKAADRVANGHADYVIVDQGQYYRVDRQRDNTMKVQPYQNGISPEDQRRAKTVPQLQQEVAASNTPVNLSDALRHAQNAATRIAELKGTARDADLDDNQTALSATAPVKGKRETPVAFNARTASYREGMADTVVGSRTEIIAELDQRLNELKGMKKKDYPALYATVDGSNPPQTVKEQMEQVIKEDLGRLRGTQNTQDALTAFKTFIDPSSAPAAPAAAKPRSVLD